MGGEGDGQVHLSCCLIEQSRISHAPPKLLPTQNKRLEEASHFHSESAHFGLKFLSIPALTTEIFGDTDAEQNVSVFRKKMSPAAVTAYKGRPQSGLI